MKKRLLLALGIILMLSISIILIYNAYEKEENYYEPEITNTPLDKLSEIISSSPYFQDFKIKKDKENNKLIINDKYEINVKNTYYLMNIKNAKDELTYCNIVDAIEMSLGSKKGESIETCKETLKGSINLGGINVEFFENYKLLTVKSDELSKLKKIENVHTENDLILTDEINYNIKVNNTEFNNITTNYDNTNNSYDICGDAYNEKNKEEKILFTIYNDAKEEIGNAKYNHSNYNKRYNSFCISIPLNTNIVKYYSIALID